MLCRFYTLHRFLVGDNDKDNNGDNNDNDIIMMTIMMIMIMMTIEKTSDIAALLVGAMKDRAAIWTPTDATAS